MSQWMYEGIHYQVSPPARTWSRGAVAFKAVNWREVQHPRDRRGRFSNDSGGSAPSAGGHAPSPPSGSAVKPKAKKITTMAPSFGRTHRKILETLGWAKGKGDQPSAVQKAAAALLAKEQMSAPEINTLATALRLEADKPEHTPVRRDSIHRGAARMQAASWRITGISPEKVPNDNLGSVAPGDIQAGDRIAVPAVGGDAERYLVISNDAKYGLNEMILEDAGGARHRRFLAPDTDAYHVPDLASDVSPGPSATELLDELDNAYDIEEPELPAPKVFTGPKADDMKLSLADKPVALYDHPGNPGGKVAAKLAGPGAVAPVARWYDTLALTGENSEPIPVDGLTIEGHVVKDGLAFRRKSISYLVEKAPGESDADALARVNKNAHLMENVLGSVPADKRHHQRGMAMLQASNPADALWEQKYGIPGFHSDATGSFGGTTIWGGKDAKPTDLAHEFGHNFDSSLHGVEKWLSDADGPVIDGQELSWSQASFVDALVGGSHGTDFKETRLNPFIKPIKLGSEGVTEYGATSAREDFAESVRLWMKDRREGKIGFKPSTGENVRFADMFPERAKILDSAFGTKTDFDTPIRKRLRKEQDERFLKNLQDYDADPSVMLLLPSGELPKSGLDKSEIDSSLVRATELFAKHKKDLAAKKAAEEAKAKLTAEKAEAEAKAKAEVASVKAALNAGKLESADASKLRRRVRAYKKKLRGQGVPEDEVAKLAAVFETEQLHTFLGLDAPAEPWTQVQSTPDFNKAENLVAQSWVKKAGTTTHPLAKSQYDTASQAKANIAAELASRVIADPEKLEKYKQYKVKHGLSASALDILTPQQLQEKVAEDVSTRVSKWAGTSGDSDEHAVLMQQAVKEEFGTTGNPAPTSTKTTFDSWMDKSWEDAGDWYRTVARVMYEHTQDEFKKDGITHISAYRGMLFTLDKTPEWAKPGTQRAHLQPINSWSSNLSTAKMFSGTSGSYQHSIMIRARVPVELILGSALTGLGCLNEFEFVIFDNEGEVNIQKV